MSKYAVITVQIEKGRRYLILRSHLLSVYLVGASWEHCGKNFKNIFLTLQQHQK